MSAGRDTAAGLGAIMSERGSGVPGELVPEGGAVSGGAAGGRGGGAPLERGPRLLPVYFAALRAIFP